MEHLPDDLLTNVLGRLPPCGLAASRCVRKRWRDVVDSRRLLRADLLPLHLEGFFCLANELDIFAFFFARPSTGRRVGDGFDYIDGFAHDRFGIMDHCNGLLLYWEMVVNPATRQCLSLPPYPQPCPRDADIEEDDVYHRLFLAYDPMGSWHFEVIGVPFLLRIGSSSITNYEQQGWPLSSYKAHVFSSRKGRWEERSFVREGEAAGSFADMKFGWANVDDRHDVYWRGALYVLYQNNSVVRISLSNDKFQMMKSPTENHGVVYSEKSEKGVYSALLWEDDNRCPGFRIWFLNESCGLMEWVLKTDISLRLVVENFPFENERHRSRPWIVNYFYDVDEAWEEDDSEWDFDSGIILHEAKDKVPIYGNDVVFLGFHPYKEIGFFQVARSRVESYHLNSSKVQELGILNVQPPIAKSFPYTPCGVRELFENN